MKNKEQVLSQKAISQLMVDIKNVLKVSNISFDKTIELAKELVIEYGESVIYHGSKDLSSASSNFRYSYDMLNCFKDCFCDDEGKEIDEDFIGYFAPKWEYLTVNFIRKDYENLTEYLSGCLYESLKIQKEREEYFTAEQIMAFIQMQNVLNKLILICIEEIKEKQPTGMKAKKITVELDEKTVKSIRRSITLLIMVGNTLDAAERHDDAPFIDAQNLTALIADFPESYATH